MIVTRELKEIIILELVSSLLRRGTMCLAQRKWFDKLTMIGGGENIVCYLMRIFIIILR